MCICTFVFVYLYLSICICVFLFVYLYLSITVLLNVQICNLCKTESRPDVCLKSEAMLEAAAASARSIHLQLPNSIGSDMVKIRPLEPLLGVFTSKLVINSIRSDMVQIGPLGKISLFGKQCFLFENLNNVALAALSGKL